MKRYLTLAVAAALVAAGAGYWMSRSAEGPMTLPPIAGAVGAAEAAEGSGEVIEMVLGDPGATVEVIEYASFTCGHCANFNQTVFPELRKNYIDTGKIRFVHRDVYFDRYGLWASMVARCDPMRYFGLSDIVFGELGEWAQGEPAQIADNLRRIGRRAGLSDDQLNACMQDAEMAQTLVAWWEDNASKDGITATPSFIVNGEKYSNMSYADFARILDEKLAE
ncbi:DsbA family protein [Tropicimonas sp.]|uniref:DsbA family protein n=1 Tax=Tropicimonas sp. TaxID=2067044 RepID=UPI003A842760